MTRGRARRVCVVVSAALAGAVGAAAISPAVSSAAQCGPGTFYDAASDTCLVAAAEPAPPPPVPLVPPPPPPPVWNAPAPYVSASICAPIPLLNLCVGV